jgi:hypothetical protein
MAMWDDMWRERKKELMSELKMASRSGSVWGQGSGIEL